MIKRSGWIVRMGSGGCDAVSQYWNMLACGLAWELKAASWFQVVWRILLGIICQSWNVCLANFNVFGNLGRKFVTEKLKGSLIAPVELQKCTGLPMPLLGWVSLPISKIDTAYQYHRTVSNTLSQGTRVAARRWRHMQINGHR